MLYSVQPCLKETTMGRVRSVSLSIFQNLIRVSRIEFDVPKLFSFYRTISNGKLTKWWQSSNLLKKFQDFVFKAIHRFIL